MNRRSHLIMIGLTMMFAVAARVTGAVAQTGKRTWSFDEDPVRKMTSPWGTWTARRVPGHKVRS